MKTVIWLLFPLIAGVFAAGFSPSFSLDNSPVVSYVDEFEEVDGERIYRKKCKWCHGKDGNKTKKNVASLVQSQLPEEEKTDIVKNGRGTMPPFGEILNEAEIDAVVTYVTTFANP